MIEWRDVVGCGGNYRISNFGAVWSKPRRMVEGGFLEPSSRPYGHQTVHLTYADGKRKIVFVHRLVLEAFVGPPPTPEHQCRHLDGNPRNNRVENLAWGTPAENNHDMDRHGTRMLGDNHAHTKVTSDLVAELRSGPHTQARCREYAKRLGMHPGSIYNIIKGKRRTHDPRAVVRER